MSVSLSSDHVRLLADAQALSETLGVSPMSSGWVSRFTVRGSLASVEAIWDDDLEDWSYAVEND